MAIAFDTTQRYSNIGTPGTSVSGSYTMSSGSNRLLVVFVSWNAGSISSITYGGVPLVYSGLTTSGPTMSCYTLVNPPTGANTLAVTTSLSATTIVDAISYTGAQVYGPIDATANVGGYTGGTTAATSVTTKADKCWVVGWMRSTGALTFAGSGFTARQNASNVVMADTNGPANANSTLTLTGTYTPTGATTVQMLLGIRPAGNIGLVGII